MNSPQTIYEIPGQDQIDQHTSDFYRKVNLKPNLRSLYPDNPVKAQVRLALFLNQASGGLQTYLEQLGHPRLRMSCFKWEVNTQIIALWLEAMFAAVNKQSLESVLKATLSRYFTNPTTYLIRHA
jgi:hemoglobin